MHNDVRRRALWAAVALVAAACAGPRPAPVAPAAPGAAPETAAAATAPPAPPPEVPTRPSLGLFSQIRAPTEVEPAFELAGAGVQIFRCEPDKDGYRWAFRLPEAELRDARGQVVAHHGANYSFEHVDGSRLLGTIVGYDSAPGDDAVRWLLLRTQSFGQGELEKVSYVQRVDTAGGLPPAQCSAEQANQILRVPFSAKFVFYRPR
ncbi:MAG TPA: DUF3455 domain-containing protein [Burkholderiaceae bacterium]|jgi:hypothetical protein|nr:DUF3455 domain-containing protein [Burkholderiaceae bacterium]